MILGGEGKGQDFSPLKLAVAEHARAAVLIGRDADMIETALQGCGKTIVRAQTWQTRCGKAPRWPSAAMRCCCRPACASFDMFRNYEHRAEVFVAAVRELQREAA